MIKKLITLLFIILISNSINIYSQSVEEIVKNYYRAMGGIENLRNWKSMKAQGEYISFGEKTIETPFLIWYIAPDKVRVETDNGDSTSIYASNGEKAWLVDPARGVQTPTYLSGAAAEEIINNADQYPFIDYNEKGHKAELLGTEEFEGRKVYRIKLALKSGAQSIHLFDSENGRELKIIVTRKRGSKEFLQETIERDFQKIEWLLLPFRIDTFIDGRLIRATIIDNAEINIAIDESLFELPVYNKQ